MWRHKNLSFVVQGLNPRIRKTNRGTVNGFCWAQNLWHVEGKIFIPQCESYAHISENIDRLRQPELFVTTTADNAHYETINIFFRGESQHKTTHFFHSKKKPTVKPNTCTHRFLTFCVKRKAARDTDTIEANNKEPQMVVSIWLEWNAFQQQIDFLYSNKTIINLKSQSSQPVMTMNFWRRITSGELLFWRHELLWSQNSWSFSGKALNKRTWRIFFVRQQKNFALSSFRGHLVHMVLCPKLFASQQSNTPESSLISETKWNQDQSSPVNSVLGNLGCH